MGWEGFGNNESPSEPQLKGKKYSKEMGIEGGKDRGLERWGRERFWE